MTRALEGMPVPLSVTRTLSAQAVSPQSRGVMGGVWVLGGAVPLAPIFIVAAGVTITVLVSVRLTEEAIEAARRRRKVKDRCRDMFVVCQELGPPCMTYLPGCGTPGLTPCGACNEFCLAENPYDANCRCYSCGFR
jgi:hypothetical protein